MSKKTRKKSPKSASGRSPAKTVSAKAKAAKGATAKKPPKSVAAKKAVSKRGKAAIAETSKAKSSGKPRLPLLNEGDKAPAFSLPRDGGRHVSLADYAGRKLVIFFYPRADTPGCTLEAVAFSRLADAFASAQTAVLGVSADPVAAQDKFRDKHELTVPLGSDEKLGMLKAYGVWGEKSMYGKTFMGISRTTVLIDASGRIARIWRHVKVDGHADEVLEAARST